MIENINKFLVQRKKNYLYKIEKLKFLNSEMLEIKNVLQFNYPNLILISPFNIFYKHMNPNDVHKFLTTLFLVINPFKFFFYSNFLVLLVNLNVINIFYLKKNALLSIFLDNLISQTRSIKIVLRKKNLYQNFFQFQKQNQTLNSFNYQWRHLNDGRLLLTNENFKKNVTKHILSYTKLSKNWFFKKMVLDLGSGNGRFSYGLLNLKCKLTIFDQSKDALTEAQKNLKPFKFKRKIGNILDETVRFNNKFDMVWCYGVVHHTGNIKLALNNIKKFLKKGGYLFLMVYGEPSLNSDYTEVNQYTYLRNKTKKLNFKEKQDFLTENYSQNSIHSLFDAISPSINELYTLDEIKLILQELNFRNITRTVKARNHHIIANLNG